MWTKSFLFLLLILSIITLIIAILSYIYMLIPRNIEIKTN